MTGFILSASRLHFMYHRGIRVVVTIGTKAQTTPTMFGTWDEDVKKLSITYGVHVIKNMLMASCRRQCALSSSVSSPSPFSILASLAFSLEFLSSDSLPKKLQIRRETGIRKIHDVMSVKLNPEGGQSTSQKAFLLINTYLLHRRESEYERVVCAIM